MKTQATKSETAKAIAEKHGFPFVDVKFQKELASQDVLDLTELMEWSKNQNERLMAVLNKPNK